MNELKYAAMPPSFYDNVMRVMRDKADVFIMVPNIKIKKWMRRELRIRGLCIEIEVNYLVCGGYAFVDRNCVCERCVSLLSGKRPECMQYEYH